MLRTYPKGSRVESSNFNPMPMWKVGVHMASVNFQKPGTYLSYCRLRLKHLRDHVIAQVASLFLCLKGHRFWSRTNLLSDGFENHFEACFL